MNTIIHTILSVKIPVDADYSALTEEIDSSHKALKFKVGDEVRITKYQNVFNNCYTKNWSKEIFVVDSPIKTNPWTYKVKDLNRCKVIGSL